MGKTYLRYVGSSVFGVISTCTPVFDTSNDIIITGALEYIAIWNSRKGILLQKLKDSEDFTEEVTELCISTANNRCIVAAGYSKGTIKLWDIKTGKCVVTLNGHKRGVTALRFNKSGSLIVSGAQDTNVIVWDVVNEAGLYKLRGHKNPITDCVFLEKSNRLLSCSKDSLVKIWDLETQHCIQTIVTHRGEVWSMDINPQETRLITGSNDPHLRVWSLDPEEFPSLPAEKVGEDIEVKNDEIQAKFFGSMPKTSKERVAKIRYSPDGKTLACQCADNTVEIYNVASADDVKQKQKKRQTKLKKKMVKEGKTTDDLAPLPVLVSEELPLRYIVHASSIIKSFSFNNRGNQIVTTLANNQIEVFKIESSEKEETVSKLELPGHRTDIRDVALSSDDKLLLSASNKGVKIWNMDTLQCNKTLASGYALCGAFVPGNKHVVIGTKDGSLELFDLASAACITSIKAHTGAIWSLDIRPDKTGLITGSADKTVKFWDFELVEDKSSKAGKQLTLTHTRALNMSDDVLCVKFSPNNKLFAASLLDSTVKIFFEEDLKFFLSLYGHKLPVMSMSISSDNTLITTASADKNVKIWGLDFGDCHKSIFAHEDTVTAVKFVPKTHYFWTCSKDKLVKCWDGDKFEQIQVLPGHQGHVWCMAISSDGSLVVTGSADKSLRIWQRTDEPLFLEEERERAMEQSMLEGETNEPFSRDNSESTRATRTTIETLKASERLLEALELCDVATQELDAYSKTLADLEKTVPLAELEQRKKKNLGPIIEPPAVNPIFMGLSPSKYVLKVLKDIKSSEIEEALLLLPYAMIVKLVTLMDQWVSEGLNIELLSRCLFFLMKTHHNQISSDRRMYVVMDSLRANIRAKLQSIKDSIGFNRAAMTYLKRSIELNTNSYFFEDALQKATKKQKQKQSLLRSLAE